MLWKLLPLARLISFISAWIGNFLRRVGLSFEFFFEIDGSVTKAISVNLLLAKIVVVTKDAAAN